MSVVAGFAPLWHTRQSHILELLYNKLAEKVGKENTDEYIKIWKQRSIYYNIAEKWGRENIFFLSRDEYSLIDFDEKIEEEINEMEEMKEMHPFIRVVFDILEIDNIEDILENEDLLMCFYFLDLFIQERIYPDNIKDTVGAVIMLYEEFSQGIYPSEDDERITYTYRSYRGTTMAYLRKIKYDRKMEEQKNKQKE